MNEVAGKTVYKDVKTKVNPTISSINKALASGVQKTVNIKTNLDGNYRRLNDPTAKTFNVTTVGGHQLSYATGTDYHPGGPFIAGEEGFELGRMGNRWEWLELGRYNKPAGYEVFTHGESKKIIQALNNMPGYSSGASPSGQATQIVNQLNRHEQRPSTQSNNTNTSRPIYLTIEMDGETVARKVYPSIDRMQADDIDIEKFSFKGGA